jgi:outer membrane protein
MALSHVRPIFRAGVALTLVAVLGGNLSAQQAQPEPAQTPSGPKPQQFVLQDYTKPRSHFPNPIGPYTPKKLPPMDLGNTPRIETLLQGGKLYLSMNDAVALALENNLDIAIQRYNLGIADTDILRAKAGANTLGVSLGLLQGTPGGTPGGLGGTIGSGPGGTSVVGTAGAGTGAAGIVFSTLGSGPVISSFDPILTGTVQFDHANSQPSNAFVGVPLLTQNTTTADFSYNQGFHWGTNLSLGFNNNRVTTNSPFTNLSPTLNSNFRATLTQHLLQGLGFAPNTRFIEIAKNNRESSDVAFRLQVITTVDQIENIYWDLVYAYENVRVQQESLAFAQKTLSDTKKQVEIGTLAPIEVVRAQSTVASDMQQLTLAQTNLQLQQLLLKNALSRTLVDPRLADAEVVPTSAIQLPAQEPVVPTETLVNDALNHRAELAEARITLANQEISKKAIRNLLLPSLDLFAYYGGTGLGGAQNPANLCTGTNTSAFGCTPADQIPPSRSYGHTFGELFDSTAPDKGLGFTLNIPLRNRTAQATQIRSEIEYRQAQLRLQQIENQVRIEVRNAQFAVQQNRAAVESAQAAVELGKQSLDAEQKKYALGASTTTLVLQNRTTLAQAESTLLSAMAAYEKAQVELDRATGLLLDHTGILISDAERGQVNHMPSVPYVGPRPQGSTYGVEPAVQTPQSPQQQPAQPEQPQQQPPQSEQPQAPQPQNQ